MTNDLAEHWIETLGAPQWSQRAEAVEHLQALGEEAVAALIGGASHPLMRVRAESVALMDHLADDRCLATLRAALVTRRLA